VIEELPTNVGVAPARPSSMLRKEHHLAFELYSGVGAYFITVCADHRRCLFSSIEHAEVRLKRLGRLLEDRWLAVPDHHAGVELDYHVVMPNHFHATLFLNLQAGLSAKPVAEDGLANLSRIVNSFKASVTRLARRDLGWGNDAIFQRNYWDRIVRSDEELWETKNYIINNPLQWHLDKENPDVQIQH
jgi:putative transposase